MTQEELKTTEEKDAEAEPMEEEENYDKSLTEEDVTDKENNADEKEKENNKNNDKVKINTDKENNKDDDKIETEENDKDGKENESNKDKRRDSVPNKDKTRKVSVPKRRSVRNVAAKRKRNVQIWPCGVCDQNVRKIRSVYCNACKKYCHFTRCSGLKSEAEADKQHSSYRCPKCVAGNVKIILPTRRRPGRPRTNTAPTGSLYVRIPTKRDAKGVEFPNIPVNIPQNKLKVAEDEATKQKNKAAEDEATKQKNKDKQAVSPAEEEKTKDDTNKVKEQIPVSENILQYDGINITIADKDSLKEGNYVVDSIIAMAIANYIRQNKKKLEDNNVILVMPSQAWILKSGDREVVRDLKKHLKIGKKSMVVIPVTDAKNPMEWSGGNHWTVLVWNTEENFFYHLDSIPGSNTKHAKELAVNLMDTDWFNDEGVMRAGFKDVECGKQVNGVDCGLYVIHNMWAIAENAHNSDSFEDINPHADEVKKIRKVLDRLIEDEMKTQKDGTTTSNADNIKVGALNIIEEYINNNKKNEEDRKEYTGKTKKNDYNQVERKEPKDNTRVCKFFIKNRCRFGDSCRYNHKKLCTKWKEEGDCDTDGCKHSHPTKCKFFFKGICKRRNCGFLHPSNLVISRRDTQNNNRYQGTAHKNSSRYVPNYSQNPNQDQGKQLPRSNFGQGMTRGWNPRAQWGKNQKMKANQNMSKMKQKQSYSDVVRQQQINQVMELVVNLSNNKGN